jgi:hypothetical protein
MTQAMRQSLFVAAGVIAYAAYSWWLAFGATP